VAAVVTALLLAVPVCAHAVPPNEVALRKALLNRGVIPRTAAPDLQELYFQSYLARKSRGNNDKPNPIAARGLKTKADGGSASGGAVAAASAVPDDNVLVLLVEFAGSDAGGAGPLHNEIADPTIADPADNTSFWIPNFSPGHYRDMLFGRATKSFTNYFLEQSGDTYLVSGEVSPEWVRVPHSEAYYGADQEYGDDNLNGPVWRVVQDAVAAAGNQVDWAKYDADKDGYVDHIMLVHAGAGQEAGGGAQGDNAIWSHSWFVNAGSGGPSGLGGVQTSNPSVWVGPYTIMPEDGTVGVFTHEFTHDLGAPDLYDTNYTGEASTGFWTLMASGSWLGDLGQPLGVSPSAEDAWTKYILGWADPAVVKAGDPKTELTLKQTSAAGTDGKVVKVELPDYQYQIDLVAPKSGTKMWWSGMGDDLNNTLTKTVSVPSGAPHLKFATWYDIEAGYDYGYVEVKDPATGAWKSLLGNLTSPAGTGYGISGASGTKWAAADYDLTAYAGKTVEMRFRYFTDGGVAQKGWAIDDVSIGGSAVYDAETDDGGWVASPTTGGWVRTGNPVTKTASRFYLAEWRQPVGFDTSMNSWYNWLGGNTAEFVAASPGMLLWYVDTRYLDNWVGVHPWAGRTLLVDAQPKLATVPYKNGPMDPKTLPLRTRIQIFDAAFSTQVPAPISLTAFGVPTTIAPQFASPAFDDSKKWYDDTYAPYFKYNRWGQTMLNAISSVKTPAAGVKITVKSGDQNSAKIAVDYSRPK
jgi:immune inhibitor A